MSGNGNIDYIRLKDHLDVLADRYNCIDFIELDPISIPHRFCLLYTSNFFNILKS